MEKRLVMRRPQVEALARATFDRFVTSAVAHVERFFPGPYAALGPAEVERGVRHALARARAHGLETERELLGYVTLVFYFGRDFDRDPALPWAREILASGESPPLRIGQLQAAALAHQELARGYVPAPNGGSGG